MKKIFYVSLFVLMLLAAVSPAFAMQCKAGNYGSDECWTEVRVSSGETTPVIPGTVLIYDFTGPGTGGPDAVSYQVRVSSAVTQGPRIAGVAQKVIATGDSGMVLVRGQGKVRLDAAAVASGDNLFPSATAGTLRTDSGAGSRDRAYAIALAVGAASTTADAYIEIV